MKINFLINIKRDNKMLAFVERVDASNNLFTYFNSFKDISSITAYESRTKAEYQAIAQNEIFKKENRYLLDDVKCVDI